MRTRQFLAVITALLASADPVAAQNQQAQVPSPLTLELKPVFDAPLGDSARWFSFGGGVDMGMRYRLPGSLFFLAGGISYAYAPIQANTSASLAALHFGGGVQLPLTGGISVSGFAAGGYYFATYNDFSANSSNPYLIGGAELRFALTPLFRIEVGAQYTDFLGLYQGLSAGAGVEIALGNLGGSVDIPSLELRPAFPVFYKHYDDHPVGTLQIKSNLRVPATDIRAQLFIREYMDAPKTVEMPGTLAPGQSENVDLYALFTDKVLAVTEGTKVATEISVSYRVEGQSYEDKRVETLTLWGRNAMTWDDNRKAAAYVTAKDPGVLDFARGVTSFIRGQESRAIPDSLQAAIALHEALDLYGMNYTPNPKTPYAEASKQKDVIDFLQFPSETLQYRAGDCSDLSILYGAMFEAVGIDAAFVTVPGHIYVAVDTGLTAEQAPRELIPSAQFIPYKGHAWVPLEVTSVHEGFNKAWELGAKEWAENNAAGQAGFFPISEAWTAYQPVGLPGANVQVTVPPANKVLSAYLAEAQKYLDAALSPQIAALQDQINTTGSPQAMNSMGVLYAKYGQAAKAEQMFKQVLTKKAFLPSLLNLGHLYFQQDRWQDALTCYTQANEMDPSNPHTLLALARADTELKNYADARANYEKLKGINPDLAAQFAYLGQAEETGARASDIASERRVVLWEGEQ